MWSLCELLPLLYLEVSVLVLLLCESLLLLGTREGVKGDVKVLITCRLDNEEEVWVPMLRWFLGL